jgi:predicted metal-dependent phosphoesterase TrpH
MGQVDLHIHTTASDGHYTPTEIVAMALRLAMKVIAIADHDSTDGVPEAQRASDQVGQNGLEVIPAVEINVDFARTELHILGYYVDIQATTLQRTLEQLRESRLSRAQLMVKKLRQAGVVLSWDRVAEIAGEGSVGRPHIARALVERGYVTTIDEAFTHYIGRNGRAYVERHKLEPADAIRLVLGAGGIPVLAHPLEVLDMVPNLVQAGLAGLEVYYTGYSEEEIRLLLALAAKHKLLVTGGSDFHGGDVLPESRLGNVDVPLAAVEALRARHVTHNRSK